MPATTLRVSTDVRDRIGQEARARGLTASAFVSRLLDEYQRAQRFAAFGAAFTGRDADYQSNVALWDTTSLDGQQS